MRTPFTSVTVVKGWGPPSMPKLLRIAFTGFSFLAFNLVCALLSFVVLPLKRLHTRNLSPQDRREYYAELFQLWYGRHLRLMRVFGLLTFEVPPPPPELPKGKPFVLLANHPSLIDVIVLRATVPGITCLVKQSWYNRPHFRNCCIESGDFCAERGVIGSTSVLDRFVEQLENGYPVLVFPEGTRSPKDGLRRFKRGACEAAIRAGVPVVPLFIDFWPPTLKSDMRWHDVPDRRIEIKVEYLPIIDPVADGITDSAELTRRVKRALNAKLQRSLTARNRQLALEAVDTITDSFEPIAEQQ